VEPSGDYGCPGRSVQRPYHDANGDADGHVDTWCDWDADGNPDRHLEHSDSHVYKDLYPDGWDGDAHTNADLDQHPNPDQNQHLYRDGNQNQHIVGRHVHFHENPDAHLDVHVHHDFHTDLDQYPNLD
jgi:hypothetical protein